MSQPNTTTAWIVRDPGGTRPLALTERPLPEPLGSELLIEVSSCGVCRTDLHLAEGDLPPHLPRCTPGHEAVGRVLGLGPGAEGFEPGDRVGIPWLASTCGTCSYCRSDRENLCRQSRYTGWDRHGGYARHALADARYVYRLPEGPPDAELAPLLCAGIIGYRALARAELPPGGRLGLYGFGASAHLAAQLALSRGATVHVLTRGAGARHLALELGAASAGGAYDPPPEPLDAAVLFAPVGDLVPVALAALAPGGTLSIAGIHLTDIPPLVYRDHLFEERTLRSTTANTRGDGRSYLAECAVRRPRVHARPYPFAEADRALADLAGGRVTGAAVLLMT